ncbi:MULTISPECIES: fatty acyl-AMP ligase [unclassified Crossiella]|uniref:fatty acyl-AMP ligase n=1 Tax=unclassified Crossiella TaxID=2620835 RepID=UPI001FFFF8F7|nr:MULTISPECIES: fatty acyl-AMP ligase [unclassified Crossiella]MCK2237259.1 fatty acyl-AMP ligase [Crossiella sp. S99.2]MCK2250914.1 fatty acyl-AMP ligase [Crossiella sp. S99.1]
MTPIEFAVPEQHDFTGSMPLTGFLHRNAERECPAFTFVDYSADRAGIEHTLTWRELDVLARALAAQLRQTTAPGARVAILTPHDLNYVVAFLGCLYAGVIGVPLFAPEVSLHGSRLVGALADCDPEVWLATEHALPQVRKLLDGELAPSPKQVLAVDKVDPLAAVGFRPAVVAMDDPAYLQYTSGSTRAPSGAVITHRNLVVNSAQIAAAYQLDQSVTCSGWIPFFHDMGLMSMLAVPVLLGARGVFCTPFAFLQRPERWLRQLAAHPNTLTAAPNFAFDYTVARTSEEFKSTVDLSRVKIMINGSEPVRAKTIERFNAAFGPAGLRPEAHRPSYGLAEATVYVTATGAAGPTVLHVDRTELSAGRLTPSTSDTALALVGAGSGIAVQVLVVDPATGAALPEGTVGEVWVHGPNVANGYWQKPEESAEDFDGHLTGGPESAPRRGWLRTGDLGAFHEGELFITGRAKDLIIIDGKNHYPQDIEGTVHEAHPAIRRDYVAAFALSDHDSERVVVIAEYSRHAAEEDRDPDLVGLAVRQAVAAHHDLRLADFRLVPPGKVRRTSSGKIARNATREQYLGGVYGERL